MCRGTGGHVACVAWRFKQNERRSREEPGGETTEKPPARMTGIFC